MNNSITIDLGTDLTIAKVGAFYIESLRLLVEDNGLQLDLSELQVVDTAGVQFLLALSEAAKEAGYPLQASSPNTALTDVIQTLGLESQLAHFMHA